MIVKEWLVLVDQNICCFGHRRNEYFHKAMLMAHDALAGEPSNYPDFAVHTRKALLEGLEIYTPAVLNYDPSLWVTYRRLVDLSDSVEAIRWHPTLVAERSKRTNVDAH